MNVCLWFSGLPMRFVNSVNFAGSAALEEVCALLCAILAVAILESILIIGSVQCMPV